MAKRASLAAAANANDRAAAPAPEVEAAKDSPKEKAKYTVPPSRQGRKHVGGYFEPEVLKQLKFIGVEQDKSQQELVKEALNDLFEKYDKPPIA